MPLQDHYDFIYLSPHLDDAALSCGGQIHQRTRAGASVLVATVMAGDPAGAVSDYAQSLQDRWELPRDAIAARRAEDREACRILGADALHGTIPDCIYRVNPATGAPLYLSDPEIFADVHPAERDLVDVVAAQLRDLPHANQLVAPLTLGHHVDHQIVRRAAEQIRGALIYYEDYPYAQDSDAFKQIIGDGETWHSEVIPLDEAAIQAKIDAIWAYRSQISTFWSNRAELEGAIRTYTQAVGGERLWITRGRPRRG